MNEAIQFDPAKAAIVTTLLLAVGAGLKHYVPFFPNNYIPVATLILGVGGFLLWTQDYSAQNIILALYVAFTATGLHSSGQSLTQPTTPKTDPP